MQSAMVMGFDVKCAYNGFAGPITILRRLNFSSHLFASVMVYDQSSAFEEFFGYRNFPKDLLRHELQSS
jgi:hypothetical protein